MVNKSKEVHSMKARDGTTLRKNVIAMCES